MVQPAHVLLGMKVSAGKGLCYSWVGLAFLLMSIIPHMTLSVPFCFLNLTIPGPYPLPLPSFCSYRRHRQLPPLPVVLFRSSYERREHMISHTTTHLGTIQRTLFGLPLVPRKEGVHIAWEP